MLGFRLFSPIFRTTIRTYSVQILNNRSTKCFLPQSSLVTRVMSTLNIATTDELKHYKNTNSLIIDVREPKELKETGTIPGSINIPWTIESELKLAPEEFEKKYGVKKPNLDSSIIFSCRSGKRSANACMIAGQLGYTSLKNFDGGWLKWADDTLK